MHRPVSIPPGHTYSWLETWARLLTPLTLWIFSVGLRYGLYGDCRMVIGPSSSRLVKASSVFVQQVQVRDDDRKGVFLYSFSEKPELSFQSNWTSSSYLIIGSYSREGFAFWLNKGSRIKLRLEAQTSTLSEPEIFMLKGERKIETLLPKFTSSPNAFALNEPINSKEAEFSIEEDDRYYLDIINTNPRSIIMKLNLNVSSMMYDISKAKNKCSTIKGSCQLRLLLPNTHYLVLTTPSTGGNGDWYLELSFVARVVAYIAILGFITIVVFIIMKYLGTCDDENTVPHTPVEEVTETDPIMPEKTFGHTYGTYEGDEESVTSSSSEELYDAKLCIICYDDQRNCFIVPCGHCATCYDCAQRGVFHRKRHRFCQSSYAAKHLGYNFTTLVWASYGPHWRNLRRIATLEILSSNRLQMLYGIRRLELRSLIRRLYENCKGVEFKIVDMKSTFFELTLNDMMRMIAGNRYYGEDMAEMKETRQFKEIVTETFELSGATNIGDFVPLINLLGRRGLEERLVIKEKNKALIDVLLPLQETEPEYCTDEIIRGMILVMLSAGTDTSSGTMEWALSLLLSNPETLVKARAEIHAQVEQSRLIEESDLEKFPYMRAIAYETLRMCPAAPLLVPHESSEECTAGGYSVPRGTMLLVNMWAIQNDPKLWEEAEVFRPERFQGLQGLLIQCIDWERTGDDLVDMTGGPGLTRGSLGLFFKPLSNEIEVVSCLLATRHIVVEIVSFNTCIIVSFPYSSYNPYYTLSVS
ncbi:hypothetical protein FNV43_RR11767 [Rhamnella rubrinervis]|uniref:Uncharacterized protein n=1 Tax=Rhamnella rubrinervis TaxID=2594499 RepID=A0A8K0MI13_9ROSA|nr:hypothetical protein FNV43_RR11767 [Rhamnella rubrinervis]